MTRQEQQFDPNEQHNKEAQEEANVMRAQLQINPYSGKIPTTKFETMMNDSEFSTGGREPTAEDYDAALAAIEELEKLAANEPVVEKVVNIFGRLTANSLLAGNIFMWAIRGSGDVVKDDLGIEDFSNSNEKTNDQHVSQSDKIESWKNRFEDATYRLRQLSKQAKQYGKE